jgi:hypothetical protein
MKVGHLFNILLETTIEYVPVETKYIEYEDRLRREPINNMEFAPYRTNYTS